VSLELDNSRLGERAALRVCFVSTQYPPLVGGGIGRFTADLARGFAAAGHEVHVMSAQAASTSVTFEDGVWVHRFSPVSFIPDEISNEAVLFDLLRISCVYSHVMQVHRVRPFDIVSSPLWQAEGLLLALDPRLTSVLSLHTGTRTLMELDAARREDPGSVPRSILERLAVANHLHTHANSMASLETVSQLYANPNGPFVIHHGVVDHAARFSRRRGNDERIRVLVTGRLERRKGADVLLQLIPALLERFSNLEFALVGAGVKIAELGDKSLFEALAQRLSGQPKALERVMLAGLVSDHELYQHYADADIFLFPSRYESFGLPVIEAMSFRLPVVACKAGGVCETVADGENGILTNVEDCNGLIESVSELVRDPLKRQNFGMASRKRYLEQFSSQVSLPRTIAAYRKIAALREPVPPASLADESLIERFARVIAEVSACQGASALRAARSLVDDTCSHEMNGQWRMGEADHHRRERAETEKPELTSSEIALPRVTVIVTCFNYAQYVSQALNSVMSQTYDHFDCVIVDDASTDKSDEVIEKWIVEHRDKRFRLIQSESTLGQMACFARGLAESNGEFVAFLDADDIWFPEYLKRHIEAHLNRTFSTGISFSNVVQINQEKRTLSGTFTAPVFGVKRGQDGFFHLDRADVPDLARGSVHSAFQEDFDIKYIPPGYVEYPWSVTSAMVCRRSLLELLMPGEPERIRICADGYIFVISHYFAGSLIIEQALGAYRRHGANQFAYLPVVGGGGNLMTSIAWLRQNDDVIVQSMLAHLLRCYETFANVFPPAKVRKLIRTLFRKLLRNNLAVEDPKLREVLGAGRVLRDRLRSKVSFLKRKLY
jgi:glycosyltransferase involved in cell wall biosynthesis